MASRYMLKRPPSQTAAEISRQFFLVFQRLLLLSPCVMCMSFAHPQRILSLRALLSLYLCVKDNLKAVPAVLQLPIGSEADFIGVIDLVTMTVSRRWRGRRENGKGGGMQRVGGGMEKKGLARRVYSVGMRE